MSRTSLALTLCLLLGLCATAPAADLADTKPLAVENLGVPLSTMRRSGDFLIPKADNKGWWFVTSYNPMRRNPMHGQLFIVDLDTRKVRMQMGEPTGGGLFYGWSNKGLTGADGKYYIAQYGSIGVWIFDPADGSMTWRGSRGDRADRGGGQHQPWTSLAPRVSHLISVPPSIILPASVITLRGGVAKWTKAMVCKTIIHGFESRRRLQVFPCGIQLP